jgi:hypothetical protein
MSLLGLLLVLCLRQPDSTGARSTGYGLRVI